MERCTITSRLFPLYATKTSISQTSFARDYCCSLNTGAAGRTCPDRNHLLPKAEQQKPVLTRLPEKVAGQYRSRWLHK